MGKGGGQRGRCIWEREREEGGREGGGKGKRTEREMHMGEREGGGRERGGWEREEDREGDAYGRERGRREREGEEGERGGGEGCCPAEMVHVPKMGPSLQLPHTM